VNQNEYQEAKVALFDAIRRKEFDVANAIRRLILYFYKPNRGMNAKTSDSVQDLPKDPCTLGEPEFYS